VLLDRVASFQEFANSLDILQKSAARQQPNVRKEISKLVEDIRQLAAQITKEEAQKKALAGGGSGGGGVVGGPATTTPPMPGTTPPGGIASKAPGRPTGPGGRQDRQEVGDD